MPIPLGILAVAGAGGGAATYELIETAYGTGSNTLVTFNVSSLSTTYKHLQIRFVGRQSSSQSQANASLRFNSDSAANYAWHALEGISSTVYASNAASRTIIQGYGFVGNGSDANIFGSAVWDILDPFSTTKNKTVRSLGGGPVPNMGIGLFSGLWRSTAAVTSISVGSNDWNLLTGTRISLYGIRG
jgi:hypothetical protein